MQYVKHKNSHKAYAVVPMVSFTAKQAAKLQPNCYLSMATLPGTTDVTSRAVSARTTSHRRSRRSQGRLTETTGTVSPVVSGGPSASYLDILPLFTRNARRPRLWMLACCTRVSSTRLHTKHTQKHNAAMRPPSATGLSLHLKPPCALPWSRAQDSNCPRQAAISTTCVTMRRHVVKSEGVQLLSECGKRRRGE